MKILYISPYSPLESVGGVERYISNLIKYYKNRSEHKIYLVLPTINKSRIEKEGNVIIYLDNNFSIPQQVKLNQKIIAKNVIKRKPGYLYYVDGKGNVCEAKMARGGKKKKR